MYSFFPFPIRAWMVSIEMVLTITINRFKHSNLLMMVSV